MSTGANWLEVQPYGKDAVLHNGDGLCYYDLQKELVGVAINRAEPTAKKGVWRLFPKDPMESFRDLRTGVIVNRNRDMDWVRSLEKKSSERRIDVWLEFSETQNGFALKLTDEDGHTASTTVICQKELSKDTLRNDINLREHLSKFGATDFNVLNLQINLSQPWFVPASLLNALRREVVMALEKKRLDAYVRPQRGAATKPPVNYPEDSLTYLANVYNQKAHDFYAKHGVRVIEAAYESNEELGEASLMITKHCVRFSMSLCPKQAKGVTGVQGTVKAEPLMLINGSEKLTLRFDCKPCEMHVVGKIKKSVLNQRIKEMTESPITFYKTRS